MDPGDLGRTGFAQKLGLRGRSEVSERRSSLDAHVPAPGRRSPSTGADAAHRAEVLAHQEVDDSRSNPDSSSRHSDVVWWRNLSADRTARLRHDEYIGCGRPQDEHIGAVKTLVSRPPLALAGGMYDIYLYICPKEGTR